MIVMSLVTPKKPEAFLRPYPVSSEVFFDVLKTHVI